MPAANVIQLRTLLSEKFPGLRMRLDEPSVAPSKLWPTGLAQIDEPLQGGLPQGALTEIVAGAGNAGGSTLIRALLQQAGNTIVAFIDGSDSLDVEQIEESALSRLLWVRCHAADEALKAADLILRDGNLPLVMLDLRLDAGRQSIPATLWYRLQRLVEQTSTVCVILTPRAMVSPAQTRLVLHSQFSLESLEGDADELLHELKFEISRAGQVQELAGQNFA